MNVSTDYQVLANLYPDEIVELIKSECAVYINLLGNSHHRAIALDDIETRPNNWRLKVDYMMMLNTEEQIEYLKSIAHDIDLISICKKLIDNDVDECVLGICLYLEAGQDALRNKDNRLFNKLFLSENFDEFKRFAKAYSQINNEVVDAIERFKSPLRKSIQLNEEKLILTKTKFQQTVAHVECFIGDDDELKTVYQKPMIAQSSNGLDETHTELLFGGEYNSFLREFMVEKHISVDLATHYAERTGQLVESYIGAVNQALYETFEDQVLIIQDDYIQIDEFYYDDIKEILESES